MIARFHYDRKALARFLDDDDSDDANRIASHLDSCEQCQRELELLADEGLSMELAGELLRGPSCFGQDAECGENDSEEWALAEIARGFLQPTDQADSLGRFARYEILGILGRGGMGIVMRGFDSSLDRHCAIKVLAPELAGSGSSRRRFSREAKTAAAVVHPHVVPIQTVDEFNGLPYLVMPVVEGQSVETRVHDGGPLEVVEAVRIAAQAAAGLAAAHEQGLVHRDIKPANVLLQNGVERVQITDFGLARAVDDASVTRSGVIAGTPQYMSPEQAHGDGIDHRSDLFSFGSLIYFMLAGHSPFRSETTMGVLNRINNDQPRCLRSVNPEVPEWLEHVVTKLLEKQPENRFQSAADVAKLLEGCLAHLQQPTTTPLPDALPIMSPVQRRHSSGKFIATAVLGFFAFGMLLLEFTTPPDISGHWAGDDWQGVELVAGERSADYTGTYDAENGGQISLRWSRVKRRFIGEWREGGGRQGKLSIRFVEGDIRGAWSTKKGAQGRPGKPRLADLHWTRTSIAANSKSSGRPANTSEAQVPFLGDLPAVGRLFRSSTESTGAEEKRDSAAQRSREHAAARRLAEQAAALRAKQQLDEAKKVEHSMNVLLHSIDPQQARISELRKQAVDAHVAGNHEEATQLRSDADSMRLELDRRYGIEQKRRRDAAMVIASEMLRPHHLKQLKDKRIEDEDTTIELGVHFSQRLVFPAPVTRVILDEDDISSVLYKQDGSDSVELIAYLPHDAILHVWTKEARYQIHLVVGTHLKAEFFHLDHVETGDAIRELKHNDLIGNDLVAVESGEQELLLNGLSSRIEKARYVLEEFDTTQSGGLRGTLELGSDAPFVVDKPEEQPIQLEPSHNSYAARPIKLERSEDLNGDPRLCQFSRSGTHWFRVVGRTLRVYRTSDGAIEREVEIPSAVFDPRFSEFEPMVRYDSIARLSLALDGQKLIFAGFRHWHSRGIDRPDTRFRPHFVIFDVDAIVSGKKVSPVIIPSFELRAKKGNYRPHAFVCSLGSDRLVFVNQSIEAGQLKTKLVLYDLTQQKYIAASEIDLESEESSTVIGFASRFPNAGSVIGNNIPIAKGTFLRGENPEKNVLVAFRGSNIEANVSNESRYACEIDRLHLSWDEYGHGTFEVVDSHRLDTAPAGISPSGDEYLYYSYQGLAQSRAMKTQLASFASDQAPQTLRTLKRPGQYGSTLADGGVWSPNGERIYVNDNGRTREDRATSIHVHDATGKQIATIATGQGTCAYVVDVSASGRLIVTGAEVDRRLKRRSGVFDADSVMLWHLDIPGR